MKKLFILLSPPLFLLLIAVILIAWILKTNPEVENLQSCVKTKMYKVNLCPDSALYVRLDEISEIAVEAILLSEDASFFGHEGFDWHELKESILLNLEKGRFARGGSTITQQLAKNVYLTGEKSLLRKLREAIIAVQLENRYSKKIILEKYLNVVEFGPQIYGIKAASKHYFNKPPKQLHLLEGAWLAFLLPSPKKYYQSFEEGQLTDFAEDRITQIIDRLRRFKRISDPVYSHAIDSLKLFPWYYMTASSFDENRFKLMDDQEDRESRTQISLPADSAEGDGQDRLDTPESQDTQTGS